ncbi:hypothetical protein KXX35_009900, partial [Aspergillus fumigatus]
MHEPFDIAEERGEPLRYRWAGKVDLSRLLKDQSVFKRDCFSDNISKMQLLDNLARVAL